jgi:hypothetical protein
VPVYTIHIDDTHPETESLERMILVPEKFNFWAFGFGPLWLLWNRLFLAFAAWLILFLALVAGVILLGLPLLALQLAVYGLSFLIGLEGNELYRRKLKKRGYALVDIASGANVEEAERRFLTRRELYRHELDTSQEVRSSAVTKQNTPLIPIGSLM